ncbi:MAG: phosphoenolpyruvate--protein phosphotransferase, partial [Spirochaetaceae bacterium]|nr:phosphoenolpyruvate--protein phosphotransferase [Spirochaetaceae bacterium]
LPETGPDEAVNAAEKLQEKFKNSELDEDSQFPSINIGVAIFGLYKIDTDHKLLSAADTALRKANESGSEKIILFQGDGFLDISEEGFEIQRITRKQGRQIFDGIPIHRGMAVGHIFIYNDLLSHELESYDISDDNLEIEFIRISTAIHNVEKDLVNMEHLVCDNLTEEYAAIFQAHRLILKDNQVLDEIKKNLYEKKVNGETIVREVFKKWEKRFLAFEDEVFKNKSHDIADISGRIIKELQGIDSQILESAPADSIILANRLLPSDTVNLNRKNIKAIVTKEGSRFSHMAILSKAMNIPLVIVEDLDLSQFGQDDTILVDGEKGSVIINPSEDELSQAKETIGNYDREHISTNSSDLKDFFYKGEPVYIHAAASNRDETEEAVSYGVQGIGLFRMEVFYLSQNELPDEETLKREIERILEPCKSKEIVIRLLDIGGDKNLSYLDITERYNSSLGLRGVRLFKKFPHLLETQLRAIIKLSQNYSVKILIPMVTLVDDITFVREMYEKIKNGLKIKEEIPIGAMIETPAAVLAIDPILECCDFVSIGSNDLIQYTVAADREKLSVSQYYEEGGKIVQEFIKIINEKALKSHKKCYLCGELAQNRIFTRDLMEIGCRNFTITSSILPAFKKTIKALSDS